MTAETRAALESLAAKYDKHFGDGKGFTKTPEELAAAIAYPDTLNALIYPERRRMPENEVPSTRVLVWWTAPESHSALGEGIERWEHRTLAYRSEAACLDAIEAWARGVLAGPSAAEICWHPDRPLGVFEMDRLESEHRAKGKVTTEARFVSGTVERGTNREGKDRVLIAATWDIRVIATRQEQVTTTLDGVECKGSKPVVTVIRDWFRLGHPTTWSIEAERHVVDLKWAPESAAVGA